MKWIFTPVDNYVFWFETDTLLSQIFSCTKQPVTSSPSYNLVQSLGFF